jgi:hypothetical protein
MGQKKDIGTLFENKLKSGKKNPDQNLWVKLNQSLDEETRKRKRKFLYWVVGGGLFVSLGLLLLLINGNILQPNLHTEPKNVLLNDQSNSVNKENNTKSISEKETDESLFKTQKDDSLIIKNSSETLSNIELTKENSEKNELENFQKTKKTIEQKNSKKKSKKDEANKTSIDETFSVTTKYYYYNNEDGERVVTTNKNEIDSLIVRKQKSLDSITTKIDSLKQ